MQITRVDNIIIEYGIQDAAISELSKRYSSLEIVDTRSYRDVVSAISDVRGYRVAVEKKRKELKADVLEYGRKVDGEAKRITALLVPIEESLKAKKQVVDNQKAADKAEKDRIEAERIKNIRKKISDIQRLTVGLNSLNSDQLRSIIAESESVEILPAEYAEFVVEAKQAQTESINIIRNALGARIQFEEAAEARKAESLRLEKIRAEQEAERKRLAEEQAKFEAAKRAEEQRIAEEQSKLNAVRKAEEQRIAKEQAKLDAEKRKIQEEKDAIEAAKQAEIARIERKALEKRLDEEAKVKAEKEAEEKAKREEEERIVREKAEEEEAARQEALKPDKEKLENWAKRLLDMTAASVTNDDAISVAEEGLDRVYEVAEWVLAEISKW